MRGSSAKARESRIFPPPLDDRSRPCTLTGAEGLARIICTDSLNNHDNLKFMFTRSVRLRLGSGRAVSPRTVCALTVHPEFIEGFFDFRRESAVTVHLFFKVGLLIAQLLQ